MGRSPVGSIRVLPRLFLVRRGFPAAGRKISAALCTTMEEMAGEEAALIGYRDGAAGESAAAVVLWSSALGQTPEKPAGGFGITEGNPYSIIQDWKLTLVVAASPYVGYRVEDEELVTQHSAAWPGWFGICSQRTVSLGQ